MEYKCLHRAKTISDAMKAAGYEGATESKDIEIKLRKSQKMAL